MNTSAPAAVPPYARIVALHSISWWVVANVVGLWLATTLLYPALGNALAPLTWGRWTPLHMTWHLYGWCALPVVGVLFFWILDSRSRSVKRHVHLALGAWSLALLLGGISWLSGIASGKLFLDWHGWARPVLPIAMFALWGVLAWHLYLRWRTLSAQEKIPRALLLALLLLIPAVIFWTSGRDMYHPVNPGSGGATGAAVLGSVLGIITLFMLLPRLLSVSSIASVRIFYGALTASWLVFITTDHGNVSHHALPQILALATLLIWVPLLPLYWRRQAWSPAVRPWLHAASAWWGLLVITGWLSFLPGFSESFKFTHALVGHAHLAMAGLLTCVNAMILITLSARSPGRTVFWLWQGGCAVYVLSMMTLGWGETRFPSELFRSEDWTQAILTVRLGAGMAMTAASVRWLLMLARA